MPKKNKDQKWVIVDTEPGSPVGTRFYYRIGGPWTMDKDQAYQSSYESVSRSLENAQKERPNAQIEELPVIEIFD